MFSDCMAYETRKARIEFNFQSLSQYMDDIVRFFNVFDGRLNWVILENKMLCWNLIHTVLSKPSEV